MIPWGRREIKRSREFDRILHLPEREAFDENALAQEMTDALKAPGGSWKLRPIQAQALYELMMTGGLFGPMGVGTGKTLVFLMAAVVLGLTRPVGLLPANLIEKTERERRELAEHWRVARHLQLVSYETLGRESAKNWLEIAAPDGIITDETHRLKNPKAACTRRVDRYLDAHPETKFVALSGTMSKKSLRDFAHILRWCLGASKAPIPQTESELGEWADCLDERVNPMQRVKPGALSELAAPEAIQDPDASELSLARQAFHHRLTSTPGVVCSLNAEQVDCSLYIDGTVYEVEPTTESNFDTLRNLWETPDGWALSEAVDVWRHARELALGFHYVWDPRPPDEWLQARRAWAKFVRDILARSHSLDSEKQVALECESGELPALAYREWKAIEPTFKINQKAVWHDETVLNMCAKWLAKEKGICWVGHTFFGRELARRTKLPYYGQSGLDESGTSILDAKGPIIASVAANGTGKNLQAWNANLIVSCPPGADIIEQLIARTHRPGQLRDEVTAEVLIGCIEHVEAWERAIAEAKMARDIWNQPQKILVADVTMPSVTNLRGSRWVKSTNTK